MMRRLLTNSLWVLLCLCWFISIPITTAAAADIPEPRSANTPGLGEVQSANETNAAIIVAGYTIVAGSLWAGERVTLAFCIQNTSQEETAGDISLRFYGSVSTLYPIFGETNVAYLPALAPGESFNLEKEFIISDTVSDIVSLGYELRYREMKGATVYTGGEGCVYLPVFSANSLNISLNVANSVYAKNPVMVSGFCTNTGSHVLKSLYAEITGDFIEESINVPLGDVYKGDQVALQQLVTFHEAGANKRLNVSFVFSDVDGNEYRITGREYSVLVFGVPGGVSQEAIEPSSTEGRSIVKPTLLVMAALSVAVALYFYNAVKKKKEGYRW